MKKLGPFGTAVFLVGCVAGVVAKEAFNVPRALAQPAAGRQDYLCFGTPASPFGDTEERSKAAETQLKAAGREAWVLVTAVTFANNSATYCMRRDLP